MHKKEIRRSLDCRADSAAVPQGMRADEISLVKLLCVLYDKGWNHICQQEASGMNLTPIPTPAQSAFQDWEFGVFFHFGIRTFYEGHQDWDGLPMPPEAFDPKELDCRQWLSAAREAGARYAILVCKHHDGFANWPTKYSDYSVAGTPWKDGKGDVVREFTDACRELGLKVGL